MPAGLIPFHQGKGKMLFNPTQMHQCAQGIFLTAFFFLFFFFCQVVFTPEPWSERDISSGLMIVLPVSA